VPPDPVGAELEWVTGRYAGRFRFIEAEIVLRMSDLEETEVVIHHIETRIRQAILQVDRVVIHAEPMQRTHLCYAVPLDDREGTVSELLGRPEMRNEDAGLQVLTDLIDRRRVAL
jgi:hypothetical protein